MPVIRIDVPEGTDQDIKKRIREGVKQAVLDTLAPKETKYDYVAVREVFAELGDGVPLVTVDLRPGREAERKKALVDAIAVILKAELKSDPIDLYVLSQPKTITRAERHFRHGCQQISSQSVLQKRDAILL